MPYTELKAVELLFRHRVLRFLEEQELSSDERTRLLSAWKNDTFSVHKNTTVHSKENTDLQTLAFYAEESVRNLLTWRHRVFSIDQIA